jgi:hypothetical protein
MDSDFVSIYSINLIRNLIFRPGKYLTIYAEGVWRSLTYAFIERARCFVHSEPDEKFQ